MVHHAPLLPNNKKWRCIHVFQHIWCTLIFFSPFPPTDSGFSSFNPNAAMHCYNSTSTIIILTIAPTTLNVKPSCLRHHCLSCKLSPTASDATACEWIWLDAKKVNDDKVPQVEAMVVADLVVKAVAAIPPPRRSLPLRESTPMVWTSPKRWLTAERLVITPKLLGVGVVGV